VADFQVSTVGQARPATSWRDVNGKAALDAPLSLLASCGLLGKARCRSEFSDDL